MTVSPFSVNRNRYIFTLCWVLIFALHYSLLKDYGIRTIPAAVDSFVSNGLLACVCLLISNTLQFYRPKKNRYLYLLIWCLVICALWSAVVKLSLTLLFSNDPIYSSLLNQSMIIRFNTGLLLTGCVALISVLWYNLEEQQMNEKRKSQVEAMAREAELSKLRQQLQPHFLFNSLNSISALAGSKPEQARKMIQQLSDFLRGTLKKEDARWISVDEELAHLELYLEIEKVRFAHRLKTVTTHDDASYKAVIPPMILQPIVENAIKFGLYDTIEEIEIGIDLAVIESYLVIRVENPFDPETSSPASGTGFGLKSLQRRLHLLFGRIDLLTTSSQNNKFITIIKIPQPHDQGDNS